jgi:hypothetical protein
MSHVDAVQVALCGQGTGSWRDILSDLIDSIHGSSEPCEEEVDKLGVMQMLERNDITA